MTCWASLSYGAIDPRSGQKSANTVVTLREKLFATASEYCLLTTGKTFSALSNKLFDEGKSLDRVAAGGDCFTGKYEEAMAVLREELRKEKARRL